MRVQQQPEVCSPLLVMGNLLGELYLVLNLKYLKQYLHVLNFNYGDLRIAALMFEQGDYNMFKFNWKFGRHSVDIWLEHYKFLEFYWDKNGEANFIFSQFSNMGCLQLISGLISLI